jgi:hypothetical protein
MPLVFHSSDFHTLAPIGEPVPKGTLLAEAAARI